MILNLLVIYILLRVFDILWLRDLFRRREPFQSRSVPSSLLPSYMRVDKEWWVSLMRSTSHLHPMAMIVVLYAMFPASLDSSPNNTWNLTWKMKSEMDYLNEIQLTFGHHFEFDVVTVSTPAKNISKAITTAISLSIFNSFSSTLGSRFPEIGFSSNFRTASSMKYSVELNLKFKN